MADTPDSAAGSTSGGTGEPGVTGDADRQRDRPEDGQAAPPPRQYGGAAYAQSPYAQPQYGQAPYGQGPYGQAPYGQGPYSPAPYGKGPYGQAPYGGGYPTAPYGASPYGQWVPPAPKPGIIPLRPLSVGEILDGAFAAVRRTPLPTLGFAAIVMTVYGVVVTGTTLALTHLVRGVAAPVSGQPLTSANTGYLVKVEVPAVAVIIVAQFLATTLLTGMLASVLGHSVLGRPIGVTEAWRLTRKRLGALFGTVLLSWVIVFGTVIGGSLLSVLAWAGLRAGHVAPLGVLLMVIAIPASIVFGVIFFVRLAAAPGVVILEGQRPAASIRRSWRLVRKSSWRVFGILLLAELIVLVATGVLTVPFSVIGALVGGHGSGGNVLTFGTTSSSTPIVTAIIIGVGGIVAGAVARPVMAGVQVLLYVDLRMRREGLDIALQSATGDGGQQDLDFGQVWAQAPLQPAGYPAPAQWSQPVQWSPPAPPAERDTPPDQQRW